MFDLTRFTLSDMSACCSALRRIGAGAGSMEEVAQRIVRYLYGNLIQKQSGETSCALVRFFKTQPFGDLPPDLQKFARTMLNSEITNSTMKCLVLLGTAGDKPEWNSRMSSVGHQAIPLPSESVVTQFPMISQLIQQFGLEVSAVIKTDPTLLVDLEQKAYHVFRVSEAIGNPNVPAQEDFVIPWRIRSVLGFGGILHTGNFFAIILFSKIPIPQETAEMFRTLALSVKVAILPFEGNVIFSG